MKTEMEMCPWQVKHYPKKYGLSYPECQVIHTWLRRTFGSANKCENPDCNGKVKKYTWALKKGCKYERSRDNYMQLCRSCHAKYDMDENTIKILKEISPNANKTHCIRGHLLDGENVSFLRRKNGNLYRNCVICTRMISQKSYYKSKGIAIELPPALLVTT